MAAGCYFKKQIPYILLFGVFSGIFLVIFYLYNIRIDAVKYAFFLSAITFGLFFLVDFWLYYNKHKKLLVMEKKLEAEWEPLPKAWDLIEKDYARMLQAEFDKKVQAKRELRMARQDMLDYYSMWVHQIKTPIAAMQLIIQSWEESMEGGEDSCTKSLRVELFKIEQYVEMVLSYLKMEEMGSDLVLMQYPLIEIIKQAVRKYSTLFILRKIKLKLTPMEDVILTDEKWVVFVLGQVLSNALKYTRDGSVSIYMEDRAGRRVLIIEDTGIGIQQEDIPRVFERGFTGYNGREDKKSTGIGLYLCKSIMDKLGHEIFIESEEGNGTRVGMSCDRAKIWIE